MIERRGNVEVRIKESELDEIILYDDNNKVLFHMEQMSETLYWMRFQNKEHNLVVNIGAIEGLVEEDVYEGHKYVETKKVTGPKIDAQHEWESVDLGRVTK